MRLTLAYGDSEKSLSPTLPDGGAYGLSEKSLKSHQSGSGVACIRQ